MATAKIKDQSSQFKPVTIEVTLESQAELDLFAKIFNYTPICNFESVSRGWCRPIRDAALDAGGQLHSGDKSWSRFEKAMSK